MPASEDTSQMADAHSTALSYCEISGKLGVQVNYCDNPTQFRTEQIVGLLLKTVAGYAKKAAGDLSIESFGISVHTSAA